MPISFREFRTRAASALDEACWKGYTQKGMKKKGKKIVPNCVKEDTDSLEEIAVPTNPQSKLYAKIRKPLHELSKNTLRSYVGKAALDMHDTGKKSMSSAMKAVTDGKPMTKKYAKKMVKRYRGINNATKKLSEGSEGGALTKRGNTAKDRDTHSAAQAQSERLRGVKTDNRTDARSYGRFHPDKYNAERGVTASDRAGRKKTSRPSTAAPQHTAASNSRIMDILNHPHYKKIASKD